jgi:hypothetical protein
MLVRRSPALSGPEQVELWLSERALIFYLDHCTFYIFSYLDIWILYLVYF